MCIDHYFAYDSHFAILRGVWIRTQRAAIASRLWIVADPHQNIAIFLLHTPVNGIIVINL